MSAENAEVVRWVAAAEQGPLLRRVVRARVLGLVPEVVVIRVGFDDGAELDPLLGIEWPYGIVYTIEDGLIRRDKLYGTPEEALEAAGLGG